ncbi:MAG: hypothetical protein M3X11_01830 [Acidobacteriota bacterium]|nr:hypothetical protein [Acidobacteriota bacterium]
MAENKLTESYHEYLLERLPKSLTAGRYESYTQRISFSPQRATPTYPHVNASL